MLQLFIFNILLSRYLEKFYLKMLFKNEGFTILSYFRRTIKNYKNTEKQLDPLFLTAL